MALLHEFYPSNRLVKRFVVRETHDDSLPQPLLCPRFGEMTQAGASQRAQHGHGAVHKPSAVVERTWPRLRPGVLQAPR